MADARYEVIVTPFAETALVAYDEYLRHELFADQAADDWLDVFEGEVASLSVLPERYPLLEKEPWHSAGVRCHPVKGFNIYDWISDERLKVYIIDVVSQRMNQDKRLIKSMIDFHRGVTDES